MSGRWIVAAVMTLAVVLGGYAFWLRRRDALGGGSAVVELCTAELHELFRAHSTRPLSRANARARCSCVERELEKSEDGREVLRLIGEYKKFMTVIESAASHAAAFEAMSLCNH